MFGRLALCRCFLKSAPRRTITAAHYTRPKKFFCSAPSSLSAALVRGSSQSATPPIVRSKTRAIPFRGSIAARLSIALRVCSGRSALLHYHFEVPAARLDGGNRHEKRAPAETNAPEDTAAASPEARTRPRSQPNPRARSSARRRKGQSARRA